MKSRCVGALVSLLVVFLVFVFSLFRCVVAVLVSVVGRRGRLPPPSAALVAAVWPFMAAGRRRDRSPPPSFALIVAASLLLCLFT